MQNKRLHGKTLRISRRLEKFLGIPVPPARKAHALEMLIATLLSQNTNDWNSHRAHLKLKERYPKWEDVLRAPNREIAAMIRVGGMANQKSSRIKKILRKVKNKYGKLDLQLLREKSDGEVFEELLSLDGVGLKTAACVLVFSLGRDVFPVDTHIHRICSRLGLTPNCKTPENTFERMKYLVPKGRAYAFHVNLIRFGREVCKARNPLCRGCPLYDDCEWGEKVRLAATSRLTNRGKDTNFMLLDNV